MRTLRGVGSPSAWRDQLRPIPGCVEVALPISERGRRTVRGDAMAVGDAVDPCGQAAGDGYQRTVSIDPSSVDCHL
jgi:hypothetical protein